MVESETVVACEYQVERAASLAKLGYRARSILPWRLSSEVSGSSSNTTITTGAPARASAVATAVRSGSTSSVTGEASRNGSDRHQ